MTVETCPHYLAFSAEEIPDGDTRFKCAPPIRDAENKEKLWKALMVHQVWEFLADLLLFLSAMIYLITHIQDGDIDMLSSDHSPTVPELKLFNDGDFLRAWGGISSLQVCIFTM